MNELNPSNAFGELLLDLITAQYGDMDAGIQALMDATGLAEEEVVAIISGDTIVDTEDLLSSIVDAFPDADDDDLAVIVQVATGVNEEDRAALEQSLEGEESPVEEATEAPSEEMPAETEEQFSKYDAMNQKRLEQLEQQLADFQYSSALNSALKDIAHQASTAVQSNALPPALQTLLIGNFSSDEERLSRFAAAAQENGVSVETLLFATNYALSMFSAASEYVEFQDYSLNAEEVEMANFSAGLDSLVTNDIAAIFGTETLI